MLSKTEFEEATKHMRMQWQPSKAIERTWVLWDKFGHRSFADIERASMNAVERLNGWPKNLGEFRAMLPPEKKYALTLPDGKVTDEELAKFVEEVGPDKVLRGMAYIRKYSGKALFYTEHTMFERMKGFLKDYLGEERWKDEVTKSFSR